MKKRLLNLFLAVTMLHSSLSMAQLILPQLFSGNGGILNTSSTGVPSITATPTLGVGSTTTGRITFQNSTNNNSAAIQSGTSASNLTWTLPTTDSTGTQCLSSNGSGILAWSACSGGGGAALSGITAATGANTIASGNNTGQVWNWANTTNSTSAFTIGETTAATNGTSTAGVPNQVLAKFSTLAASTMSPLSVYSRAAHVFSVSPTTAQIFATSGVSSAPSYAFAASAGSGMGVNGTTNLFLSHAGGEVLQLLATGSGAARAASNGTTGTPFWSWSNSAGTGFSLDVFGPHMVLSNGGVEVLNFPTGGLTMSKGTSDTVGFGLTGRKARTSVSSPTVITTGDDLVTISGHGYVGNTNTYREAARITFDSVGTISDAANGIGGDIKFSTQKQGVDTSPAERFRIDQNGHALTVAGTANTPSMGSCGTSPSVAGTDNAMLVTVGTGGSATSCAISFGSTWATNAPNCVAQNDTDIVAYKIATTTGGVTISASAAFTASSKFHVLCMGMQ